MVVAVPCPWTCGLTSTAGRPAGASDGQTKIEVSVMRRIRGRCVAIGRLLFNPTEQCAWLSTEVYVRATCATLATVNRSRSSCTELVSASLACVSGLTAAALRSADTGDAVV